MPKLIPLLSACLFLSPCSPAAWAQDTEGAPETKTVDPDHARLVAARRAAHEVPEVVSAQQQAKADLALAHKAQLEAKTAHKKAMDSEARYRKCLEEELLKIDPSTKELIAKEKAAFREKMTKARHEKKGGTSHPEVEVPKGESEKPSVPSEETTTP